MAIHKRSNDLSQWNADDDDSQEEISQEETSTTENTHVQIKMDYQKTMIIVVAIFSSVTLVGQFLAHYIVLLFGFLIPAYNTFKAIKLANSKLYVRWAMYWTVFGMMFTLFNLTDILISWFPMYQQFKCLLVYWLASATQRGSSIVYRRFLHQLLEKNESNIDRFLLQKQDEVTAMIKDFGSKGIDVAGSFVREGSQSVLKVAAQKGYTKEKMIAGLISGISNVQSEVIKENDERPAGIRKESPLVESSKNI